MNREVVITAVVCLLIGFLTRFLCFSCEGVSTNGEQWLRAKDELDDAQALGKEYVKFYFNPKKSTLQKLNSTGYRYIYNFEDTECIERLSKIPFGSSEYYIELSRDYCYRRHDSHLKVFIPKEEK